MYFHGARFSNYEAWLSDPTHIKPSAQVVWPIVGQEILNGDVGGGFQGIQITSGFFQLWRASGITSELQLYTTAIGGLVLAAACFFAGWFHYHKAAPKLEWFQNVESMLNHHLGGLLGLGSLGWAGHQIHVSLPVNKLLDAGIDPKEIPLPHELLLNKAIMADLYPSFAKGLAPFFTLNWAEYSDFLTFKGGLNPVTGGLWLSDTAHHHVAIAVLFLVAGHQYRTNWGIGHSIKEILDAHKGPFTGEGHVGLYEILTTSWHAQLAINLALFGSLSIIVACKYKWVTLNPTICWNASFVWFNTYPQVLKLMCLSASLNLLQNEQLFTKMVSNNSNITLRENLVGRNNQQETKSYVNSLGSSETLRGTVFSHTKNSHINSNRLKKKHKTCNFFGI
jgi:photosystem I P700 chlorophyll a apoprotein A1